MKLLILLLAMLLGNAHAEDSRPWVKMLPAAAEFLRQEMLAVSSRDERNLTGMHCGY